MSQLERRLERLEQELVGGRQRFIWVETGDGEATALVRAGELRRDEVPVFVSWAEARICAKRY
jgi:hypothetical protein